MPLLSLVTGKVERDASFQRLVDSIVEHTTVECELIVSDASAVPYVPTWPEITVIHENPRQTHSKGYNSAFRRAKGKYILWLNDDAEVCPNYDVESIAFMESHPRIGLGALHYSENGGPFHINQAWGVPYANFGIFRKDVGEKVHYFDEEISMYGADNSLVFRILLADYGVADIPTARILHHSTKDQIRADNQFMRRRDTRMLEKNYLPTRNYWLAAYKRHRVPSSTEPWAHGIRPEAVKA